MSNTQRNTPKQPSQHCVWLGFQDFFYKARGTLKQGEFTFSFPCCVCSVWETELFYKRGSQLEFLLPIAFSVDQALLLTATTATLLADTPSFPNYHPLHYHYYYLILNYSILDTIPLLLLQAQQRHYGHRWRMSVIYLLILQVILMGDIKYVGRLYYLWRGSLDKKESNRILWWWR